jgi:hypothetical protein
MRGFFRVVKNAEGQERRAGMIPSDTMQLSILNADARACFWKATRPNSGSGQPERPASLTFLKLARRLVKTATRS